MQYDRVIKSNTVYDNRLVGDNGGDVAMSASREVVTTVMDTDLEN